MLYYKQLIYSDDSDWVVFLHGAGGSSSVWFKQVREFAKYFNVLLVDLRGHGRSQTLEESEHTGYTFAEITGDIIKVMDKLGINKAHFVGLSLGTVIMQQLAITTAERVKSMVMGGAVTSLNFKSRFLFGFGNFIRKFVPDIWLYKLFAWIVMPKKQHAESRHIFVNEARRVCEKHFKEWFRLIVKEIAPYMQKYFGWNFEVPTLYLMGDQDHMFLPSVKSAVKSQENAQLDIIANSGHVCNVEHPQEFNRRAISFIQQYSMKKSN